MPTGTGAFTAGDMTSGSHTYKPRFDGGPGWNPEQLIATAHAACFSMAPTSSPRPQPPRNLSPLKQRDTADGRRDATITKTALATVPREPGSGRRARDHPRSVVGAMTVRGPLRRSATILIYVATPGGRIR